MGEFISELKYMCSADNTTSRGFYMFIAIAMIALAVLALVAVVLTVLNVIKGYGVNFLYVGMLVAAIAAEIGVFFWLKKS